MFISSEVCFQQGPGSWRGRPSDLRLNKVNGCRAPRLSELSAYLPARSGPRTWGHLYIYHRSVEGRDMGNTWLTHKEEMEYCWVNLKDFFFCEDCQISNLA